MWIVRVIDPSLSLSLLGAVWNLLSAALSQLSQPISLCTFDVQLADKDVFAVEALEEHLDWARRGQVQRVKP